MPEKCCAYDDFKGGCEIFGFMCNGNPEHDCFCSSKEEFEKKQKEYYEYKEIAK